MLGCQPTAAGLASTQRVAFLDLAGAQPVALFNCHRTAAHPSFRHPATLLMPAAVNRDLPDPSCSCRRHLLVRVQPACGVRPHRPLHAL